MISNISVFTVYSLLMELRKMLENLCGFKDTYKRFLCGYDPVLEKLITDVFPGFDINSTVYYISDGTLRFLQQSYFGSSNESLLNIKLKMWLNRIRCKLVCYSQSECSLSRSYHKNGYRVDSCRVGSIRPVVNCVRVRLMSKYLLAGK